MYDVKSAIILLLAIGASPACQMQQAPPKAPETATVKYVLPSFMPVNAGTETQERGGVVVQMAPVPFVADRHLVKSCREQQALMITNNQYPYEVRENPAYDVAQKDVIFRVKVTNRTTQVLKLEGTVFKFIVNDQEVALDQAAYAPVLSSVLTPSQEKQWEITGPEWRALPTEANAHFDMFGVPTETDEAGNVTKRENFTWTFVFKAEEKAEQAQVPVNVVYMTKEQAAAQCPM